MKDKDEDVARVERVRPAGVRKMRSLKGEAKRTPQAKQETLRRKKTRRLKKARNIGGFDPGLRG